jgi:hypothetical protein
MDSLMKDAAKRKFNAVVVHKLDRFGRSVLNNGRYPASGRRRRKAKRSADRRRFFGGMKWCGSGATKLTVQKRAGIKPRNWRQRRQIQSRRLALFQPSKKRRIDLGPWMDAWGLVSNSQNSCSNSNIFLSSL